MPAPPPDRSLRPLTTAAARTAGITKRELAGPAFVTLGRGVHAPSGVDPVDPLVRILAAVEVLPRDVVIGGWAALYLLGVRDVDGRTGPGGRALLPVLVHIGPVGRVRRRAGIDLDRSTLLAEDVTTVHGISVTTAARSCVEIMCRLGVEEGVVAGDATGRFEVGQPEEITAYVESHPGLRGIPLARVAAPLVDKRSKSGPESRMRVVWVLEAGLPLPLVNRRLVDEAGFVLGEPDLLDEEAGLVGEYDGAQHRTLAQHTADNAREEDFENSNLVVVRATAIDLWPRRPLLVRRFRAGHARGLARDRSRDRWWLVTE